MTPGAALAASLFALALAPEPAVRSLVASVSAAGELELAFGAGPAAVVELAGPAFPDPMRLYLPAAAATRTVPLPPAGGELRLALATLEWDEPELSGARGRGPGHFRDPRYLAAAPWGELAVADRLNRRVQWLGDDGAFRLAVAGRELSGSAETDPGGLGFGSGGQLYLAATRPGRILRFSREGRRVAEAAVEGRGVELAGLAPLRGGPDVLAVLPREDRIAQIGEDGRIRRSYGGFGAAPGRLRGPRDIASADGRGFWVSEETGRRIQSLDAAGTFLEAHAGSLVRPAGLDVDPRGLVWVADRGTRAIHVFAPGVGEVAVLAPTDADGKPRLGEPVDVAATPSGDLVVADSRLSALWRFPSRTRMRIERLQLPARTGR